jgi:NAD+ dependent glucose-6-phosphate dehydrogenase
LFGERLGRSLAERRDLSVIAFRIGWCQKEHGNRPGPHMSMGSWGQQMWLSDRDLCQAMERAILAKNVEFAVLNLMSDNPGMRWDIVETRAVIGYDPQDGHAAVVTDEIAEREEMVRLEYELGDRLNRFALMRRW